MRLILASTSPYRAALLRRLRLEFETAASDVDERAIEAEGHPPAALVRILARAKAQAVAAAAPDAIVIGSDQIAVLDGRILGKPGTEARAREQLGAMAGRTHELLTAVAIVAPRTDFGQRDWREHVDVHRLSMRPLTAERIARYVSLEAPLDCAGSYKIEGLGAVLFDAIEGADPTAIIGLPLSWTAGVLSELGVDPLGVATSSDTSSRAPGGEGPSSRSVR